MKPSSLQKACDLILDKASRDVGGMIFCIGHLNPAFRVPSYIIYGFALPAHTPCPSPTANLPQQL